MTPRIAHGDRIPQAIVGRLVNNTIQRLTLSDLLASKRGVVVGVPGAFTPICTLQHIPDLLANVDLLRAAGMDEVICVAPSDPWVTQAWAERVDPERRLTFLSDGNLSLARALGVNVLDRGNLLGETCARYMMVTDNGIVQRLNVEPHALRLTCTRAEDAVLID